MQCPQCATQNPEVASYCYRCGQALRGADSSRHGRGGAYAIQAAESVTQFAILSTILPHTNRRTADNYRWALLVTAVIVLVFAVLGVLPAAVVAAAFLIPVTYLIYLYDVNLWEDTPLPVVVALFVLTGILSILVSLFFIRWVFDGQFLGLRVAGRGGGLVIPFVPLLLFAVVLPIVAEVVKNFGPVWLATRPRFDDMIDGFTFGVASGTAYAAFETIVAFSSIFSGELRTTSGLALWIPIILNLMIVKPLVYGTATGIAVAAFSGRGEGYDGFRSRYFAAFAFAAVMNILYWLGLHLLSYVQFGQTLALLWGLLILAVLVLRARVVLHTAVLEVAVEDVATQHRSRAATTDGGYCPECEMPLLAEALFCMVCGTSVRATSPAARRHIRESPGEGAA